MRKTKRFIAILLMMMVVLGGCGSQYNPQKTEGLLNEYYKEDEESYPKIEDFLDGKQYKFDSENYVYYKVEEFGERKSANITIICNDSTSPLGETCFHKILPILKEVCNGSFSLSYSNREHMYLYLMLAGKIINDEKPVFPEEDSECEEKANNCCIAIEMFLKDNGFSDFASNEKEENVESIILSYDKEGEYGKYDLFDGEPYLRYYIPTGVYKVKCNIKGGFYIESIEKHKEDGFETTDVIRQINMYKGEETEISIEEGQCIFLFINTEIELIRK